MYPTPNYFALYTFVCSIGLIGLVLWGLWLRRYTRVVVYGYHRRSAPGHPEFFPYPLKFRWPKDDVPQHLYILMDPRTRQWTISPSGTALLSTIGFAAEVVSDTVNNKVVYSLELRNHPSATHLEYEIE